jgi:hypothetical protein
MIATTKPKIRTKTEFMPSPPCGYGENLDQKNGLKPLSLHHLTLHHLL